MLFTTEIQQPPVGTREFETQINSEVRTGFVILYEHKFVNFIINPGLSVKKMNILYIVLTDQ